VASYGGGYGQPGWSGLYELPAYTSSATFTNVSWTPVAATYPERVQVVPAAAPPPNRERTALEWLEAEVERTCALARA